MNSAHTNNSHNETSDESILLSITNLLKLQEEFIHVDPSAVEQEYFDQDHDYDTAKFILSYLYGIGKRVPEASPEPTREDTQSSPCKETEAEDDIFIEVSDPQIYRNEAQFHYLEKKKAVKLSREAWRNGENAIANYYNSVVKRHGKEQDEANERASKKILNAVNAGKKNNILDLHLLHVGEALQVVQDFLSDETAKLDNKKKKRHTVTIVSGKGSHSMNGEAILHPTIRSFLRAEEFNFQELEGRFKVFLKHP